MVVDPPVVVDPAVAGPKTNWGTPSVDPFRAVMQGAGNAMLHAHKQGLIDTTRRFYQVSLESAQLAINVYEQGIANGGSNSFFLNGSISTGGKTMSMGDLLLLFQQNGCRL